jgi:Tfp pilus assembly protein PilN
LRMLTSKWFLAMVGAGLVSWGYFAIQAARVPLLTRRISHLEQDAQRIDSLQKTLTQLQSSYEQVERMLSVPGVPRSARVDSASGHSHP